MGMPIRVIDRPILTLRLVTTKTKPAMPSGNPISA